MRSLKAEMLKVTRNKIPVSIDNATSVGILYMLKDESEYNIVSELTKKLQTQGKKVQVMGMYSLNRVPVYYIPKLSYDLIMKKDIDFFFRPSAEFVTRFIRESFDLLIDLSNPDEFTLHYIANLSRAKFKIGKRIDDKQMPYDLMIDSALEMPTDKYIDQVVYYLSILDFQSPGGQDNNESEQPQ